MAVTGKAVINVGCSEVKAINGVNFTGSPKEVYQIAFGTTEVGYYLHRASASATTGATTYDLSSFTDSYGQTVSMSQVKALIAINNETNNNWKLVIGGGSNPLYSNALPDVYPGGAICLSYPATSGVPVTPTTKNLAVASSAGTVSYDLLVIGS